jgi:hypothetical protein
VVGEPLADEEEDEDVHSLRGGTSDMPGSSVNKEVHKENIQEPSQKDDVFL